MNPATAGLGKQFGMPLPGRLGLLVKVVERSPVPQAVGIFDPELGPLAIDCQGIGRVRLELHRARASFGGRRNHLQGPRKVTRMIGRDLGDHIGPLDGGNGTI